MARRCHALTPRAGTPEKAHATGNALEPHGVLHGFRVVRNVKVQAVIVQQRGLRVVAAAQRVRLQHLVVLELQPLRARTMVEQRARAKQNRRARSSANCWFETKNLFSSFSRLSTPPPAPRRARLTDLEQRVVGVAMQELELAGVDAHHAQQQLPGQAQRERHFLVVEHLVDDGLCARRRRQAHAAQPRAL